MQENNPIPVVNSPQITEVQPVLADNGQQPKTNNFLVILLSVLLFISVSIAGFFAYQTQKLVKELTMLRAEPTSTANVEPTTEPIATNIATTTADPTANWKTYTSTKAGYNLKYPNNWPLVNIPVHTSCTTCVELVEFNTDYSQNDPNTPNNELAVILVFKDDRIKTIADYKNVIVKGDSSIINVKDAMIDKIQAISYKLSSGIPPLPVVEYVVVKNNYYYVIRFVDSQVTNKDIETNQKVFDQILSTFKFTN